MERTLGLHQVSDDDMLRLLRALARESFGEQVSRKALVLNQFGHLEGELDVLVGHSRKAAIAVVSSVLRQRRHRPETRAQLLWSGPRPTGAGARDPFDTLQEVIATTERELLWAGVDLRTDQRLLRSLHAALRGRNLSVTLVLANATPDAALQADEVFQRRMPLPDVYVPSPEALSCALPRCIIADATQLVLLTGAAVQVEPDEREVCAGVWVTEPSCALAMLAQHRVMIDTGSLVRLAVAST